MGELESRIDEISSTKKLVLMCRTGTRSAKALETMKLLGFKNIYNLQGGILEWAQKIDPSLPQY
jgi:adenylyltransferase/sulfurtransferase